MRPSILSSAGGGTTSTFGTSILGSSSLSNETTGLRNTSPKGFIMRPSTLSAAADKIDNRKRTLSDEDKVTDEINVKKSKAEEPVDLLTSSDTERRERLHLTDELEKPVGIGTFGFMNSTGDDQPPTDKSKNENAPASTAAPSTNYFQVKASPVKFDFKQPVAPSTAEEKEDSPEEKSASDTNKQEADSTSTDFTNETDSSENKSSLLASASEYQEKKNERHHLDEIQHLTGEEGENHVLQILCKLHVFDKEKKSWLERGRGTLKLNDIAHCHSQSVFQSRLVFRTQGANIVQMNTLLWPDMCCEIVNEKSLRLTAVDPDTKEIRVYLMNANKKDTLVTMNAINGRIQALKRNQIQQEAEEEEAKEEEEGNLDDVNNSEAASIRSDDDDDK